MVVAVDLTKNPPSTPVSLPLLPSAPLHQFIDHFRQYHQLSSDIEFRFWALDKHHQPYESIHINALDDSDKTLQDCHLSDIPIVGVEYKPEGSSSWPLDALHSTVSNNKDTDPTSTAETLPSSTSSSPKLLEPVVKSGIPRGVVGLQNLGNTCFMNSALQCLSNTEPLTRYILDGLYKREINRDNPLGMHGQIAESYGNLIEHLWCSSQRVIVPREIKFTVSKFNTTFQGYHQHDSQELLAFLLDGLHEDLNRILKKPYVEKKDSDGRADEEVAEESWKNYKARNDSIIVDLFQGQYKSTLTCPECNKVSVTFDPFMYLTLPLPIKKLHSFDIFFVSLSVDKLITKVSFNLSQDTFIKDVKKKVASLFKVASHELIFAADVYNSKFYRILDDSSLITDISSRDTIYFYELKSPLKAANPRHIHLPVFCYSTGNNVSRFTNNVSYFGIPLVLPFRMGSTLEELQNYLMIQMKRFTTCNLFQIEEIQKRNASVALNSLENDTMSEGEVASEMEIDKGSMKDQLMADLVSEDEEGPILGSSKLDETMEDAASLTTNMTANPKLFKIKTYTPNSSSYMYTSSSARYGDSSQYPSSFTSGSYVTEKDLREIGENVSISEEPHIHVSPVSPSFLVNKMESKESLIEKIGKGDMIYLEWERSLADFVFNEGHDTTAASPVPNISESDLGQIKGGKGLWNDIETLEYTEETKSDSPSRKKKNEFPDLYDCLEEFTKEEMLGEDDLWYCPQCKEHRQASKKFDLWKLPEVLVVHLKRFSHSRIYRDKIDAFIDFPTEGLNMDDYVLHDHHGEKLLYDLYAVSNHYGGMGGGHYTAYAKNMLDGKWYDFDDSRTSVEDVHRVKTPAAYLLFYRLRKKLLQDHNKPLPCPIQKSPLEASPSFSKPENSPQLLIEGPPPFASSTQPPQSSSSLIMEEPSISLGTTPTSATTPSSIMGAASPASDGRSEVSVEDDRPRSPSIQGLQTTENRN